jgi:hypothetical protein
MGDAIPDDCGVVTAVDDPGRTTVQTDSGVRLAPLLPETYTPRFSDLPSTPALASTTAHEAPQAPADAWFEQQG